MPEGFSTQIPDPRLMEAMRLHVQGDTKQAHNIYETLLQESPNDIDILHSLGVLHLQSCTWETAIQYFQKALAIDPDQPRHLLPLAKAQQQSGRTEQAIDTLITLMRVDSFSKEVPEIFNSIEDVTSLALCCKKIEQSIANNPTILPYRVIAASLYAKMGNYDKKLDHLKVLEKNGVHTEQFYIQYVNTLRNVRKIDKALTVCSKALLEYSNSVILYNLRSLLYIMQAQFKKALNDSLKSLSLKPDDDVTRVRVGTLKLLLSDCRDGFEEYSAHCIPEKVKYSPAFSIPEWAGEPLTGKYIFVWAEQGIGDVIMFAGFLSFLSSQGAEIIFGVYPKLMSLFTRSFPHIRVVLLLTDAAERYGVMCDYHIPIGQLMAQALPDYIPALHPPFLKPDRRNVDMLRQQYQALSGGKRKKVIGISWHTTHPDTGIYRNIPLIEWKPLFALSDIQFISLQYGNIREEIATIEHEFPAALYQDPAIDTFEDIDAFAAQIAAMDEVISIDNSTVHLAGALGVPTTLLLSASPEWRWGLNKNTTRWYASVHIERQKKLFHWQEVIQRVYKRLIS